MSALAIAPDAMRGYLDTAHRLWLAERAERHHVFGALIWFFDTDGIYYN